VGPLKFSSQRIEFVVYFVGVVLLGLVYYLIRSALAAPVFLVGILGYLVVLRVLGRYLRRKLEAQEMARESRDA
jgi:xanthosine utilization system XapX-like protein